MGIDLTTHANRDYPPPRSPWAMAMRWHDLLFMHWPVEPERLRPHVPTGLEIDTVDGVAWIGVVPFRMTGVRARFLPAIPGPGAFPELNVRTYVSAPGPDGRPRPGVYFFSLDAASRIAVAAARATFHLRYMNARMQVRHDESRDGTGHDWIEYESRRTHRREAGARLRARYRPVGPPATSAPGTLLRHITDRYCLYAADGPGRVWRSEIHHGPWPLQPAAAEIAENTMAEPLGIDLGAVGDGPTRAWPMLHFARRMDVVAWLPRPVPRV